MVASLTRLFGAKHVDLAEDVVQETLLKAMREWPFHGVPDEPVAWLRRVARNMAIDRLRREARGLELLKENAVLLRSEWTLSATVGERLDAPAIADDQLRMMFACCHPDLPLEQQVALALRTLCGFSVPEIARAFVTNDETINKRLYRARETFRGLGRIELPAPEELVQRLDHVLAVIYLLFNEGYASTSHAELIREDLVEEALRLCDLLTRNSITDRPEVHALLALMLYHAARSATRTDEEGAIILLAQQDRSRWDRELISLADSHLDGCAQGDRVTPYHIQASIAALHAHASSFASTDWQAIVRQYDRLMALAPTPIIQFNRAVAVGQAFGPEAGWSALQELRSLEGSHLYWTACGDALRDLGRWPEARDAYDQALTLVRSPVERELLLAKRGACNDR